MPYFGIPIRNGLPIGLGSVAGFGVQQFSPADLFSAGEQGAWYDPSDLTTLFTDSAGTTPVTAVEQFVGLMLDKSKGLVLGSEIAPSTNYSSGWTTQSGVALPGTTAVYTSVASNNGAYFGGGANIVAGRFYEVTYTISSLTAGGLAVYIGGTPSTVTRTVAGTYTERIGTVATDGFVTLRAVGTTTAVISSFSIKQVTGNHATSTGTKRPKLAARYNLLTYTEQFDNGAWIKGALSVSANTSVAPDGTTTADTITSTALNQQHYLQGSLIGYLVANTDHTVSVSAKAGTHNFVTLGFSSADGSAYVTATVNLATGTVTKTQAGAAGVFVSANALSQGNGWFRITLTGRYTVNSTGSYLWVSSASSGTPTYGNYGMETWLAAGTETILVWGADLRPASQATGLIGPTYQRVVDAATYDAVGFLPYLEFNGLSWSMSTNSIDFTATDKITVWAGVRKLSDANPGMLATQTTWNSTGGFGLYAPSYVATPGGKYFVGLRGTSVAQVDYATYNAPITNVLALSMDIGGAALTDEIKMRINAANVAFSASSGIAGTGNFPNSALEIGAFNSGTNTFLNGWLTSLIIRGAQSTQSQIEATESWVNGKTGAYV